MNSREIQRRPQMPHRQTRTLPRTNRREMQPPLKMPEMVLAKRRKSRAVSPNPVP